MIRRLLAFGCLALAGCAAAQQLHFHDYTQASLEEVLPAGTAPARGGTIYVDRVLGGPYPERPRAFSKVVWHSSYYGGFGGALYEGFHRLPVDDIDAFVHGAVTKLLLQSGMRVVGSSDAADYRLAIKVERLYLKTDASRRDYRAGLARLRFDILGIRLMRPTFTSTTEGLAKLRGSNTEVGAEERRSRVLSRSVRYTGGDPDVVVLAIADAVRKMLAVTSSSW